MSTFRGNKSNKSIKNRHLRVKQLAKSITRHTHFSIPEVESLLYMYETLCEHHHKTCMDKILFCDFCENCFAVYDNFLLERLFKALDEDEDGSLNGKEWVKGMNLLLLGNLEELAPLVFRTYSDSWPKISRIDFQYLVEKLTVHDRRQISDLMSEASDLSLFMRDTVLSLLDLDNDGFISQEDFVTAVKNEPLLLESLGECLPSQEMKSAFLSLFRTSSVYNERLSYLTRADYENLQKMHEGTTSYFGSNEKLNEAGQQETSTTEMNKKESKESVSIETSEWK